MTWGVGGSVREQAEGKRARVYVYAQRFHGRAGPSERTAPPPGARTR